MYIKYPQKNLNFTGNFLPLSIKLPTFLLTLKQHNVMHNSKYGKTPVKNQYGKLLYY